MPRIVANRIVANRIVANRIVANRLVAEKLVAGKLVSGSFQVNPATSTELLATDDGREVFSFLVACALPDTATIEAEVDGATFAFSGAVGIAPEWITQPLSATGQRWVSACLFARINANEVAIAISLRGPTQTLAADSDEQSAFALEEGAFFGNYFTPKDQPIEWFACRGADQSRGDDGDLANRECAEPDPENPSLTKCGFTYVGECGAFAANHACETFSDKGRYYGKCHTDASSKNAPYDSVFLQVITTYVLP